MKKKWIKSAISEKGSFHDAAVKAGKSTSEFIREHENDQSKLGKKARLAKTLIHLQKKRHKGESNV